MTADIDDEYRVLITGFGPFLDVRENPSWLAVKTLHDSVIFVETDGSESRDNNVHSGRKPPNPKPIHITALEVPTVYNAIIEIVPGVHARPPILPSTEATLDLSFPAPPRRGYDFIFHVGVGRSQPLRLEVGGHKYGYGQPDEEGNYAPMVDDTTTPPLRGFADGYEMFEQRIDTDVDIPRLALGLKKDGVETVISTDAGHYCCDFITYCSLAESKRAAAKYGSGKTPVLFVHCPPVGLPLSTEQVADGLKRIVARACGQM